MYGNNIPIFPLIFPLMSRVITYSRKVFIPLTNLCRDTCGYCVFARDDGRYMTPDEVLDVARKGEELGCKEALFSLGERPELRHAKARETLSRLGYRTTIEYVHAMCERVLHETDLIPHTNAGALDETELRMLKPVNGSMGMMLESVAKLDAHRGCPDKTPARRIATLEAAGRLDIPFTTGLLIGIGETWDDRIKTLETIRDIHARHGHIQEVIIQNFRAKSGIAMEHHPEPSLDDMVQTISVAREILPPEVSLQAPPNLMPHEYARYIDAGINDWGGISPLTIDHINPEAAWPKIEELAAVTASKGFELQERWTVYPRFHSQKYVAAEILERVA